MFLKIFKYSGIVLACLPGAVLCCPLLYRAYLQHNVAQRRAIRSPHRFRPSRVSHRRYRAVDRSAWARCANPILLFIHGGPGVSFIPLAGAFQDPWEKHFTVVQWEQRRAGKTYASNDKELQRRTMNIPQMEQDALDVANYLRARFHRD